MDDGTTLQSAGLDVRPDGSLSIAAVRYFNAAGTFAADAPRLTGSPLPAPLTARRSVGAGGSETVLAWRSPTETLLLCSDVAQFAAMIARAAGRTDGCLVDQTGGLAVWRITGARTADLLTRLGAPSVIPALGEARTSRIAELSVMALCVRDGEVMLLVDRVYATHLRAWMAEIVGDL
jgi:sarcosine oxidase gamma subunit